MPKNTFVSTFSVRFDASELPQAPSANSDHGPVVGNSTTIVIQRPEQPSDYLLICCVEPCDPASPPCRLKILVNGSIRKELTLRFRMVACCRLPYESISDERELTVAFETSGLEPDGLDAVGAVTLLEVSLSRFSPSRLPQEPTALPPLADVPSSDAEMLRRFISFGDNCEFGLYKRRHGVDEPSFLRLAGVPFEGLLCGLAEDFAACQDPGELYLEIMPSPGGEYILGLQAYNLSWHTLVMAAEAKPAKMVEFGHHMLKMLLRLLIDNLKDGNRIIVYKRNYPLSGRECARLARMLERYGNNALLAVSLAQHEEQIGQVVMNDDGFMMGYIDKFLAYDAADLPASDVWMTICRNACECWRDRKSLPPASLVLS